MRLIAALILALAGGTATAQTPFATFERASDPVLSDPHDLAFGPDGKLYVADKFANRIVILDPGTLEITGVVADGQLPNVHDISFGPDGTSYVAVTGASAVVVFGWEDGKMAFRDVLRPFPRTEGVLAHSSGRFYVMSSATGELLRMEGTD
ncbi:MAG: hypothetical protein KDB77_15445, partial [Flavobacteriales bacterium]|nr:hypothetical protein [Flavobacteriales bacterium]